MGKRLDARSLLFFLVEVDLFIGHPPPDTGELEPTYPPLKKAPGALELPD